MSAAIVKTEPADVLRDPDVDESYSDVALWRAVSDLDTDTEAMTRHDLSTAMTESGDPQRCIFLYLGDVFVDVRGLSALLAAAREARGTGRDFVIVSAPPSLRRMCEILNIGDRLRLTASPREAIASIRNSRRAS